MRIDQLGIARYRSLYSVRFFPGTFTVLVGPNNAGKTNFADALDFLADTYRYGLEIAVGRKGGFENIAHRKLRRTKSPIQFTIQARLDSRDLQALGRARRPRDLSVTHTFGLATETQAIGSDFRVVNESIAVSVTDTDDRLLEVVRTPENVSVTAARARQADLRETIYPFSEPSFVEFLKSRGTLATELIVSPRFLNPVLAAFARVMANTRVYQLVPLEGRRPGVPTPNPDLDRHGNNLPAFVAYLSKNQRVWPSILDSMKRVIPGLTGIRTGFTPDRRLTLLFEEEGVGRPWAAEEVSDGTIQTLSLLAALFDPRSQLVVIEEPENSVHPWILRHFLEACREASHKQVLLTTHSPAVLNAVSPNEVIVVWRSGGETNTRPFAELDPQAQTLWERGQAQTFEMLDIGLVGQAVPGA